jgi:formate hydrogenlyase transcriptional activator
MDLSDTGEHFRGALEQSAPSVESLQRILDTIPTQAWCNRPDGSTEFVNQRWCDYAGISLEEAEGSAWKMAIHPDDLERVLESWETLRRTGKPGEFEGRLRRHDGEYRWFLFRVEPLHDEAGEIVNWYGTNTDIDDLKRAHAKLREDEQELRAITDVIPHMIIVLSTEGRVLYVNRATVDYTGMGRGDFQIDGWQERVYHPEDLARHKDARRNGLTAGVPFESEVRALGQDGTYRWILVRYTALRDGAGKVVRWYATGTNIDERKRAEERVQSENLALRDEIERSSMFGEVVGGSPPLRQVLAQVSKVAPTDSTVLVLGETGTGKELIARAIHKASRRANRAFIRVNCAVIPPTLIASELFGHEKGAFTGALQRRVGRFEAADGGTIFLDEVGELPADTQVTLLRVLQEREFERVGSSQTVTVDVRVIAATNRDLAKAVEDGTFRADLFYRLNVFPVRLPALRERPEDIPLLVAHMVDRYARKAGKRIRKIDKHTQKLLHKHDWPGNVRELQNVIERAIILTEGDTFSVEESWLTRSRATAGNPALSADLAEREREMIETALRLSGGQISGPGGAAARLGIPRQTLTSKIERLGINRHLFRSS